MNWVGFLARLERVIIESKSWRKEILGSSRRRRIDTIKMDISKEYFVMMYVWLCEISGTHGVEYDV
jgi:hypothetical protein